MIFFASFIGYITFFAVPGQDMSVAGYILLPISCLYALFTLGFEAKQIMQYGTSYFTEEGVIWNILDIATAGFVLTYTSYELFDSN